MRGVDIVVKIVVPKSIDVIAVPITAPRIAALGSTGVGRLHQIGMHRSRSSASENVAGRTEAKVRGGARGSAVEAALEVDEEGDEA